MKTTNKLHIKVKTGINSNTYIMQVGLVKVIVMRKNIQAVYKNLLTVPFVVSLSKYKKHGESRGNKLAGIYLEHYLTGYTVILSDTQLLK